MNDDRAVRAKSLFREVIERGYDLPLASVTKDGGVELRSGLDISVWNPGDDTSMYKRVLPGDFVIGLRSFQSGIGSSSLTGLVSPAYTVLRPVAAICDRYFHHYFRSNLFISELANVAQGIRQGRTISTEDFYNLRLRVPSLGAQQAIADFLDRETARIDALISAKRRMIELLDARFRSQVTATMSQWERVPLKRVVTFTEGPGIMAEDFRDSGVPLVRVAGVGGDTVTLDGCNYLDPEKVQARWAHFALAAGDYLISASASMGTVSVVGDVAAGAIPYTGLIRFRPATAAIEMRYVYHFLSSEPFVSQINLLKTGTAIQHFGPTHLGEVLIPLPELDEQRGIACTLDNAERKKSKLTQLIIRQVDLLRENRQALITAAVTGQIEVTEDAA